MRLFCSSRSGSNEGLSLTRKPTGVGLRKSRLGRSGEIIFLHRNIASGRRWNSLPGSSHQILCLCCSGSGVLLHGLESPACVLRSQIFDLGCLLPYDIAGVFEVAIDELLVLNVDKRSEEHDTGSDQRHTPEGDDFDEIVGQECSYEGLFEVSNDLGLF